jgi:hypothetical protein
LFLGNKNIKDLKASKPYTAETQKKHKEVSFKTNQEAKE